MTKKSKDGRLKQLMRLGICVALIALIALIGAVLAGAEEPKYSEGLKFTSNGDGTCYVSGIGSCTDTVVNIPPTSPEGEEVAMIGEGAFYGEKTIISVTIPDSVTNIGRLAFWDCSSLTSITIPDSVTSIGDCAFWFCSSLTDITIPDSVRSIGDSAFSGCSSLTSITVDKYNAFYHIKGNCLIETATKTLIAGCKTSVIPDDGSVTSIGDYAFYYCSSFTDITIPDSVTSIGMYAFCNYRGLRSVTIPDSVTSIGDHAFSYCSNLKSITIGNGVTSIGVSAFSDCMTLANITVDKYNTVYHSKGNCLIETATKTLIAGCTTSVIPDDGSVTSIGDYAFRQSMYLTSITIPDTVTSIGRYAFWSCGYLTSIIIPDSVTSIGDFAFHNCVNLKNVTIGNSVTSIGDHAFSSCQLLASITVDKYNTVYHSKGNCLIETATKTLIAGCKTSVIPDDGSVTSIGYAAFYGCSGLTSITIPDSVTSIGYAAFWNCKRLTVVSIPNSVTSIGDNAFDGCSGVISITISNCVTSIGVCAFQDCRSLTSITIPDSVTSIGIWVFQGCYSLTSITIPYSVKSIGTDAFAGCESLTDVHFGATENEWRRIKISEGNDKLLCATFHFLNDYFDLTAASLSLGESLTMNYYAKADPAYSNVKMRFTYRGVTVTVDGTLHDASGEYVFSLKGIAPQYMSENIKAELIYVTEDGTETVLDVKESYSIRRYCDDALAANPDNATLATLLADLLAYGDAAQDYANYNEDTPVSEGFTVTPSEWQEVTDTDFTLSDKTREELCFTAAGVRFGYVNRLYFKIKAADLTGVTVTVNGKAYSAEDLEPVENADGTYILYTDAVYATEFDKVITAELTVDGEVIQTVTYSVKSYVFAKQNGNDDMAALAKALYSYGRSALAYKNAQ